MWPDCQHPLAAKYQGREVSARPLGARTNMLAFGRVGWILWGQGAIQGRQWTTTSQRAQPNLCSQAINLAYRRRQLDHVGSKSHESSFKVLHGKTCYQTRPSFPHLWFAGPQADWALQEISYDFLTLWMVRPNHPRDSKGVSHSVAGSHQGQPK